MTAARHRAMPQARRPNAKPEASTAASPLMRSLLLISLLAVAGLAGCTDDGDDTGDDLDPESDPMPVTVPDPVVFTGSLQGLDTATGLVMPCAMGAQQCVTHAVPIPDGDWKVTFTLTMDDGMVTGPGIPYGTDYDLFVDGAGESTNPAGEADIVTGRFGGGSVDAQVRAWHDVDGSYTLTVTFEAIMPEPMDDEDDDGMAADEADGGR